MKTRHSNIELLRIIAMLMIVGHHLANMGICHDITGDTYNIWAAGALVNRFFVAFLLPGGVVGVAIFFIITGYYLNDNSEIRLRRFVLEVFFYGAFSIIVGLFAKFSGFSFNGLGIKSLATWCVKAIFTPVTGNLWWFVSAYFYLILLHPLLNKAMHLLNTKGQIVMIALLGITIYIIDCVFGSSYGSLQRGIFFYLIGGYIRNTISEQKLMEKHFNPAKYLYISIVSWIACAVLYFLMCSCLVINDTNNQMIYLFYNVFLISIPVISCAVTLFLYLLYTSFFSSIVNQIASTTFGVYLIHEGLFARWWIWKGILKVDTLQYKSAFFPLTSVLSVAIVFICCSLIDQVRKKWIEPWYMNILDKLIHYFSISFFASKSV